MSGLGRWAGGLGRWHGGRGSDGLGRWCQGSWGPGDWSLGGVGRTFACLLICSRVRTDGQEFSSVFHRTESPSGPLPNKKSNVNGMGKSDGKVMLIVRRV